MRPNNVVSLRDQRRKELVADKKQNQQGNIFQGIACEVPACPSWLSPEARKHYRFICGELKKAGLIAKIDQGALSILCTSYARMMEAEKLLQQDGSEVQTTINGYQQLSAASILWAQHAARYEKMAKQFGITVRARQNLKVDNPDQGQLPGL